jgi:NADH-quinone oxidoreductase subunit C
MSAPSGGADEIEAWIQRWGARAVDADGPVTVDVALADWVGAARSARDDLGATWFDTFTVIDEADGRFTVLVHLRRHRPAALVIALRTSTALDHARIPSLASVFAGAAWHEREQAEMFGLLIDGLPDARRLLLSEDFAGAPLRKDFVLAARAARPWPGLKEPGESDADLASASASADADTTRGRRTPRRRRRAAPTGVPERGQDGRW